MARASVRELHLNTSDILRRVSKGEGFIIEKNGTPIAELRPLQGLPPTRPLPNREAMFRKMRPMKSDAGRILEQDR